VAEAELMPRLLGGDTEMVCGKLKEGNRFLKPNFEPLPSVSATCVVSNKSIGQMKMAYAMTLRLKMPKGVANGQTKL
jgi:hypothetical protein